MTPVDGLSRFIGGGSCGASLFRATHWCFASRGRGHKAGARATPLRARRPDPRLNSGVSAPATIHPGHPTQLERVTLA